MVIWGADGKECCSADESRYLPSWKIPAFILVSNMAALLHVEARTGQSD